jgi:hypothetical protein
MPTERFDFSAYDNGVGNSGFGQAHGPGIDLRPQLPQTTTDLIGVDLSHRIDMGDLFGPGFAAAKGGGSGGGGGGGGGGTGFTPPTYTAGAAGGYNITIEFKGSNWTTDLYADFRAAADRLASFITGDIPNVAVIMKGGVQTVDDILITAELKTIDGINGVLGQAGPTSIRNDGSYLPATATMQFDIADAQNFHNMASGASNLFAVIVTHEMLHSVGFGSIWSYKNLVVGGEFQGAGAEAQYAALVGHAVTGVPVEQDGGSGTAGSHWDEDTFHGELMTGYINTTPYGANSTPDPLSKMTVASLGDLGYQVNLNASTIDGYVL